MVSHSLNQFRRTVMAALCLVTLCFIELMFAPSAFADDAQSDSETQEQSQKPLTILVMDPLALPLSCGCIEGFGQRRYEFLENYLEQRLKRPVNVVFEESLNLAYRRIGRNIDLIVGKNSVVKFDAANTKSKIRPLMQLTGIEGKTTLRGAIFVATNSKFMKLDDLSDRKIAIGPVEDEDVHAAVKKLVLPYVLSDDMTLKSYSSIESVAYAIADQEVDAAALPEYLPALLEGCGKIAKGSLRKIATTEEVPFIRLFATSHLSSEDETLVSAALLNWSIKTPIQEALETKRGFVAIPGWTDWRGPNRAGLSSHVPRSLGKELQVLWRSKVTGPALAGISATESYVVLTDKDADFKNDIFRCLDAKTGQLIWKLEYPSDKFIDFTNTPRAAPVMVGDLVYLQGAWGELHCVDLKTGEIVWKRHLLNDFGAEPVTWGCSLPPLLVDGKLIVTPGAVDASVVALDPATGETIWATPGHAAAYAPMLVGTFGGVRQIVGYDVAGLAGWDIKTGKRLWEIIPPGQVDFHVGTPVNMHGKLLVATENNATRVYEFNDQGKPKQEPILFNDECAPDTCTPVLSEGRIFCNAFGELFCIDQKTLETVWSVQDDRFFDHTNLIYGNQRVLAWTTTGDLLLLDATADEFRVVSARRPFTGKDIESMSHPAIVGDRLYLRSASEIICIQLPKVSRNSE